MESSITKTIILAIITYIIPIINSQSNVTIRQFDLDNPLIDTNIPCENGLAVEGRFLFLGQTAEAFFHATNGFVYFEYWFPAYWWTGIAATTQIINNDQNECLECYNNNNKNVLRCLDECVGNNIFDITAEGDPDPSLSWEVIEALILNSDNNAFDEFQLPNELNVLTPYQVELELTTLPGSAISYIHGSWYRRWNSSDSDNWIYDISGGDNLCWTTIASAFNEQNYGSSSSGYYLFKNNTEIHCPNQTVVCDSPTDSPTPAPTASPVLPPTFVPTSEPTRTVLPDLEPEIDADICTINNLTLILILDASRSIEDSNFELSKIWANDLLDEAANDYAARELWFQNATNSDTTLCMRAAVITFSFETELLFNLFDFGNCYHAGDGSDIILNAQRPHSALSRLTGTHTKDALTLAINETFPLKPENDALLVVMLTDGLPQSVTGDSSQNPCLLSPNYVTNQFNAYDARFLVVAVEGGTSIRNNQPFDCLFYPYTLDESLIVVNTSFIDLNEISPNVHNTIFEEFCEVVQYTCDTPLYPNIEDSLAVRNNYVVTNSSQLTQNLGYTFKVKGDRDIWMDVLSFSYYGVCDTQNQTLRVSVWEWNEDLTDASVYAYSNNNVTIIAGDDSQHIFNFTFDMMYSNGGGRDARYRMVLNNTYTVIVEFLGETDCNPLYPVVVVPDEDLPYTQFEYFTHVSGINQLDAAGNVPTLPTNNHANITLCILEINIPSPTPSPTRNPTDQPTEQPTSEPTDEPTPAPTSGPTPSPSNNPTDEPTPSPTNTPTDRPTNNPTDEPTPGPTPSPSSSPTDRPTSNPTDLPTPGPTSNPTERPTNNPTDQPTPSPTSVPTPGPTNNPTDQPTDNPSDQPTPGPTSGPTSRPTTNPTDEPTNNPSEEPTPGPTSNPTERPSEEPTPSPTNNPSQPPTNVPTDRPTTNPTDLPTPGPTTNPTGNPTDRPTGQPTDVPSPSPTASPIPSPTSGPTPSPSSSPTARPTNQPTDEPTNEPTDQPSDEPTPSPSDRPTNNPTDIPTPGPTNNPSDEPTPSPTDRPTTNPTDVPTPGPTNNPTDEPTPSPSDRPTNNPTDLPTPGPTNNPSDEPTPSPTDRPTNNPTDIPTPGPTPSPTGEPTPSPSDRPTNNPTDLPTPGPTPSPTGEPTPSPTGVPTNEPTPSPTNEPTPSPTNGPTDRPTNNPTGEPTPSPTNSPTPGPIPSPTGEPTPSPSTSPTLRPTNNPTGEPTPSPSNNPTDRPTQEPTNRPTDSPSPSPTGQPTPSPTSSPSGRPTTEPTPTPTGGPTPAPSPSPTGEPTPTPTGQPTPAPSQTPSQGPSTPPTPVPTPIPTTSLPTNTPTIEPTQYPTGPTPAPTLCPRPRDFPYPYGYEYCDEDYSEWKVDFHDWFYNSKKDVTYIQYEICVLQHNVFNTCNNLEDAQALESFFVQIPCLCEICINAITKDMDPNGYTTEVYQGWLWHEALHPGECGLFELQLLGYAPMEEDYGIYKIFGKDGRYIEGSIPVPNPCDKFDYSSNPHGDHHHHHHHHDDSSDDTNGDGCVSNSENPLFLKHVCAFGCDEGTAEWEIEYLNNTYDESSDLTTFRYEIRTLGENPTETCNVDSEPSDLQFAFIRIDSCECEPQSNSFLHSYTNDMSPMGYIESNYWYWEVMVSSNSSQIVEIVMEGNVTTSNNGDATLAGDLRCVQQTNLTVPNPCNNDCLFGQWTQWEEQGECSAPCGGGYQARERQCVSVCDGTTSVDNCQGDSFGYVPCNTQPCNIWYEGSSDSSDNGNSNTWWSN